MFHLETAYVLIESPNREAVDRYFRDVVGLMPGAAPDSDSSSWRLDDKVHRVIVQDGTRADAAAMGFEATDPSTFQRLITQVGTLGIAVHIGSPEECRHRRVQQLARFSTPWAVDIEICTGLSRADTQFQSPCFPDGLVTGNQGFGHCVFAISDADEYEAARRLAMEGLGLRLSDWLRMPTPVGEMHVSFLHCNARHHSLALAHVPVAGAPQRLHHINFEVASLRDVGAALDRAVQTRTPLANTIGQHDNDGMVSFYSISPDGWRIEIGASGRTVSDDWEDVREYDRISAWGHQPPADIAALHPQP